MKITRVIEVSPIIGSGSVGRIVDEIYNGLINDGHQCKVICGKVGNTSIPQSDYLLTNSDVSRVANAILARLLDNDGFCLFVSMRKVVKLIEDYDPDIIHMHGAYGYYIDIEPLYTLIKQRNYKLVSTLHSCWDYTGHCCYYTYAGCERWKTGCYSCPEKHVYPACYLFGRSRWNYCKKKELFTSVNNHVIVTPSQWLENELRHSFLQEFPCMVIPNGIDLDTFSKVRFDERICYEKYGVEKDKIIILGVAGVWDRRKGLEDFVELSEITGNDIQIVVVGVNERQRKRMPKRIVSIPHTENAKELADLYSAATILFNPTYEDNYPTVNLESIGCGTPVVTYGYGGSGELGNEYGMGQIVRPKDYCEIIKIAKQYYVEKCTMKIGNLSDISSQRMVDEYIKLFESL